MALQTSGTPHQMAYLLAKAELGLQDKEIAARFGVKEQSVKNAFYELRQRIGARTTPHAACLLWPVLEPMLEVH